MFAVKNLLNECGLEEYEDIFNNNCIDDKALELLDDDGLKQLIPIVGHQMKFKKVLKEWKSVQDKSLLDLDILEIVEPEPGPTTAAKTYETAADVLEPVGQVHSYLIKPAIVQGDKNYTTSDGRAILIHGKSSEGKLQESQRKRLSQLIIAHLLEDNPARVISAVEFNQFAADIQRLFPKENGVIYFSPYERTASARKNACGKLYETYISRRRKLRARGELPGTSRSSCSSPASTGSASTVTNTNTFSSIDSEPEDAIKEKLIWLENSVDPWQMVEQHWKATADIRLRPITLGEGNITDYFEEFPALKQPKGYTLLLQDFAHLYPDKSDAFYFTFLLKRENIIELANEKIKSLKDKDLKECMQNYITLPEDGDSDALTNVALILLAYIIGTPQSRKRGKQHWKPSRSEIRDGFITQAVTAAEISSIIETRREKMQRLGKTLQPFIIFVGESLDQIQSAFVIVNNTHYQFQKLMTAVDAAFKIFQATGACYPDECTDVWNLIQIGFYKIKTAFDRPHQGTISMLNDLGLL